MKIHSILLTNDGVQISYVEDRDVDDATGIITQRTIDIPHPVIPQSMYEDLNDSVGQILDHALTVMRKPKFDAAQPD